MMMKTSLIVLTSLFCLAATNAQTSGDTTIENASQLRSISHSAFKKGEKLTYRVYYGFVDAGIAEIEVKNETHRIEGREVLHIVGTGKSQGAFNWFFKVRDRYETYLDEKGVFPWSFVRKIEEGGYKKRQNYTFHQQKRKVDNGKGKQYDVPHGVQDMISAFYYARTLDFSNAKNGDIYTIQMFVDNELYPLQIKFRGIETIEVDKGKFRCMKFVPVVQKGRIFKEEEDMTVWITDDANRIPILAKASVLVGSINMEIVSYSGLANPIAKVK